MSIGKRIREYRIKRGLTQSQLASKLGMTEANVSSYERGKSVPPSDTLGLLADYFNVTTDYLLGRSIYSLVEKRMAELGLTQEDIEERLEFPSGMLASLDSFPPAPWDYEKGELIDKLSRVLNMDPKTLASAYSHQEPPVYNGPQDTRSVDEIFGDIDFEGNKPMSITPAEQELVILYRKTDEIPESEREKLKNTIADTIELYLSRTKKD